MVELAGYTSRVYQMLTVFEDVKRQTFVPEANSQTICANNIHKFNVGKIRGNFFFYD